MKFSPSNNKDQNFFDECLVMEENKYHRDNEKKNQKMRGGYNNINA